MPVNEALETFPNISTPSGCYPNLSRAIASGYDPAKKPGAKPCPKKTSTKSSSTSVRFSTLNWAEFTSIPLPGFARPTYFEIDAPQPLASISILQEKSPGFRPPALSLTPPPERSKFSTREPSRRDAPHSIAREARCLSNSARFRTHVTGFGL